MSLKVIIADDHAMVREGIKALLEKRGREMEVAGEAADGRELLELARRTPADVYVIDVGMPHLNGLEAASRLLRRNSGARIVCLGMECDREAVRKAVIAGVRAYVLKENTAAELMKAIYAVARGGSYFSSQVSALVPVGPAAGGAPELPDQAGRLTSKEREIIQLIAEGLADKEISRRLSISRNTVHAHRNNISRKLDIHKQTDLVRFAIREKIAAV